MSATNTYQEGYPIPWVRGKYLPNRKVLYSVGGVIGEYRMTRPTSFNSVNFSAELAAGVWELVSNGGGGGGNILPGDTQWQGLYWNDGAGQWQPADNVFFEDIPFMFTGITSFFPSGYYLNGSAYTGNGIQESICGVLVDQLTDDSSSILFTTSPFGLATISTASVPSATMASTSGDVSMGISVNPSLPLLAIDTSNSLTGELSRIWLDPGSIEHYVGDSLGPANSQLNQFTQGFYYTTTNGTDLGQMSIEPPQWGASVGDGSTYATNIQADATGAQMQLILNGDPSSDRNLVGVGSNYAGFIVNDGTPLGERQMYLTTTSLVLTGYSASTMGFPDDAAAQAAGIPVGGVYIDDNPGTLGLLRIRLV